MKKLPLILSLLTTCCVLGLCIYLFLQNQTLTARSNELSSRNHQLSSDLSAQEAELQEQQAKLQEQEDYIKGQKDYVSELTAQLSALEDSSTDSTEKEGSKKQDTEKNSGSKKNDPYPELYSDELYQQMQEEKENPGSEDSKKKSIYLTFDDGPSDLTPKVLDLLDEYDAKATFFVVYKNDPVYTSYLKDIVDRGHTLALHSYSHDYSRIYQSVDAFLADFQKVYDWVYETTGKRCTLFRFPGGSTNASSDTANGIINEMERRGFIYYDWNVSSGDGSNLTTTENVIENICDNAGSFRNPVVLMHDGPGKEATLRALPTVLQRLSNSGYKFEALTPEMEPIQHR